jgi:uncharacterized protein (DUF342 family)
MAQKEDMDFPVISEEDLAALKAKLEEVSKAGVQTEEKLMQLPFKEETEQLRATMVQLISEMHRMEKNLDMMIRHCEEVKTEGGTENGND